MRRRICSASGASFQRKHLKRRTGGLSAIWMSCSGRGNTRPAEGFHGKLRLVLAGRLGGENSPHVYFCLLAQQCFYWKPSEIPKGFHVETFEMQSWRGFQRFGCHVTAVETPRRQRFPQETVVHSDIVTIVCPRPQHTIQPVLSNLTSRAPSWPSRPQRIVSARRTLTAYCLAHDTLGHDRIFAHYQPIRCR